MKIKLLSLCVVLCLGLNAFAQQDEKVPSTFTLVLNQDNVFGFYPAVFGSFGLNDKLSLTYYGIFWTNPSYGSLSDGADLWLETGVGLSFTAFNDQLIINPSLGLTHGKLLSADVQGAIGEGLVPNLAMFLFEDLFEAEGFVAYYKALNTKGAFAGDFVLYWLMPGVKITKNVSLGLHYEAYSQTKSYETSVETGNWYTAIGGYLKFTVKDTYSFRFSAGKNTEAEEIYSPQFYKLNVVVPF